MTIEITNKQKLAKRLYDQKRSLERKQEENMQLEDYVNMDSGRYVLVG